MNWCHTRDCMCVCVSSQLVGRLVNQCEFVRPSSGIPAMAHLNVKLTTRRILDVSWSKKNYVANACFEPEDHVLDCGHMPSQHSHGPGGRR